MKVSQTSLAVKVAHEAGKPLFFWGAPGIGKSAGVKAAAGELGFTLSNGLFRDFRASQCDPCDIRGLPFGDDSGDVKTMAWLQPDWLPQDSKSAGIILLDELPDAPIAVQSALYELTLDRRIGPCKMVCKRKSFPFYVFALSCCTNSTQRAKLKRRFRRRAVGKL